MRGQYIIYQPLAEPIVQTYTPVLANPETITVDKWFKEQPNPVLRKSLQTAILAGSLFFVDTVSNSKIAAQVPEWVQPQSRPTYRVPQRNFGGQSVADTTTPVAAETITLDKWFQPISQPYFSKTRQNFGGETRFEVPRTILITDWWQPIGKQLKQPIRKTDFGEFRFEVPRTILISDWFQPIQQPVRRIPQRNFGGEFRFEVPRTILLTDWWQPIGQPYFSKLRKVPSGEYRFEVPRTILVTDWFQPASEPVRRKVIRLQGDFVKGQIIADDTQLNEWYQPASEPYFVKRRNYFTGEFRFETPRAILITDWFQPTQQPGFAKRQIIPSGEVRVTVITPVETVTLDKWFQQAVQPISIRKAVASEIFAPILPVVSGVENWMPQITQPYFDRRRLFIEIQEPLSGIVTVDQWFQPAVVPRYTKTYQAGIIVFEQPIIEQVPFEWYQVVQNPLIRLPQRNYGGNFWIHIDIPLLPYYPFVCDEENITFDKETECETTVIEKEAEDEGLSIQKESGCETLVIPSENTNNDKIIL